MWPEGGAAWIQDFELEHREGARIDIGRIEPPFKEALAATISGEVENDGFNRLLLAAGLDARQIVVMRAYCKYLLQTGVPFSQASIERALVGNSGIAQNLVRLFETLFNPANKRQVDARVEKIVGAIRTALDAVASLDEDRILRSYLNLVKATLRTNFYQAGPDGKPKPYVSFKLDPQQIPDLPLPRPKFEIFVYSPRVEGVHLRMGYVARGGLRWSDRREDFRTEVLGLMKAQNVKNTVIVPVGAKGGFYPKRLLPGPREAIQAEGIACYQMFIRGLLDVTDNIVNGRIVPPANVVRRDPDDAYLVVAADKGTATFSDIANAISLERGFWLGDAFASGGSAGYDHKGMGITARGGWGVREAPLPRNGRGHPVAGVYRQRHRRHGRRRVRQRHAVVAAHAPAGGVQSPAHLPRSVSRCGGELRRTAAPVRPASFDLGRLRQQEDLQGRRHLPALREVDLVVAAGAVDARPRRRRRRRRPK